MFLYESFVNKVIPEKGMFFMAIYTYSIKDISNKTYWRQPSRINTEKYVDRILYSIYLDSSLTNVRAFGSSSINISCGQFLIVPFLNPCAEFMLGSLKICLNDAKI